MPNEEMQRLRAEIDRVDGAILALFGERMRLAGAIGECKRAEGLPVCDERREAEILSRVRERAGAAQADAAETLFRCLLALSRDCQRRQHGGT